MKRLLVLGLSLLAFAAPAEDRFLPGFEALPLMAGLEVEAGSAMVFDKPNGRIVEAAATGALSAERVRAWYREALPELGWQPAGADTFRREGELLTLTVTVEQGQARIAFRLAPR